METAFECLPLDPARLSLEEEREEDEEEAEAGSTSGSATCEHELADRMTDEA